MTTNGKRIQQDILCRGTELDGAVECESVLTADGLKDMLTVFGIHTDMELRSLEDNK